MRFSEAWLREWVNPSIETQALADQLSMAGLEVDSVEPAAPGFSGVVVGRVLAREQHPDADKLSVCQVDVAGEEQLQIVCGAKNVAADMLVPVATVGAKLPGDFKIKKAKLRGVLSQGMICSASELGLAESSDGILGLPADAPIGTDFRDYLSLDDACIDVDLTPDRGDCLSLAGIAREVGVLNRVPVTAPEIADVAVATESAHAVQVSAPEACPRYLCRVVEGVDMSRETPRWMVERLRRGGVRAISPAVDVTNYVMLELGQPMHAFDLAKLDGGIQVRMAGQGEKLTLLDGSDAELRDDTLVIADQSKALAMAGIMGGEGSGVTDTTRNILLEAAFFAPLAIAGKARSYGLHTDSSHRFERGVDPELPRRAMQRATALLLDIVGGTPGPVVEAKNDAHLPKSQAVALRRERLARLLGIEISDEQVVEILERLDMKVTATAGGWEVTAPSCRFDIAIEADLIEEVGRIFGYADIPENRGAVPMTLSDAPETVFDKERAADLLVDRGYQEAITYSFVSPELAKALAPEAHTVKLANPISADLAVMRPNLWAGLIGALKYNLARQQERIFLFESGLSFERVDGELQQRSRLAGLAYGPRLPQQWAEGDRAVDFFDVKGDLEAVLAQVANLGDFSFESAELSVLHPGQTAAICRGDTQVGWLGLLHPAVQSEIDVKGDVFLFEVDLDSVRDGELPAFTKLSKYQANRRDFAVVLDETVTFAQVRQVAAEAAGEQIQDIRLFDVYTGEKVEPGRKSLALSLILQDSSRTLTDQDVEQATAPVLAALTKRLGAQLRD